MAEVTTFGAKMLEDQKTDLQRRIQDSNMTAADYLAMVTTSFDAQQTRETILDDRDVKLLDSHLARISEIYLSIAKNRADEKVIAQNTKIDLDENI